MKLQLWEMVSITRNTPIKKNKKYCDYFSHMQFHISQSDFVPFFSIKEEFWQESNKILHKFVVSNTKINKMNTTKTQHVLDTAELFACMYKSSLALLYWTILHLYKVCWKFSNHKWHVRRHVNHMHESPHTQQLIKPDQWGSREVFLARLISSLLYNWQLTGAGGEK